MLPSSLEANAGALFIKQQELVISRHQWSFVTDINLGGLKGVLIKLQVQVGELERQLRDTEVECKKDRSKWDFCIMLREETVFTKNELNHLIQEVTDLYEYALGNELHLRKKRGLINAGGNVLKFLFGVGTEDDMANFNKKIDKVASDSKVLLHLSEIHTSVLKDMNHSVQKNIKGLGDVTIKLANAVDSFRKWKLNVYSLLSLSSYARTIHAEFAQTRHLVGELLQSIHQLGKGQLHPALVKPSLLLTTLINIHSQLPPGLDYLLPPTVKSIQKFYEFCHLQIMAGNEMLRLRIKIPLSQKTESFQLFKIIPWPTTNENSSALIVETSTDYFAMSTDNKSYVELTESELEQCIDYVTIKVCDITVMIYEKPYETCAYALFNGHQPNPETCIRKVVINPRSRFIFVKEEGLWVYNVPRTIELKITCPQTPARIVTTKRITGIGRIILESGCIGHTNGFRIVNSYHGLSTEIIETNINIVLPNISISLNRVEKLALGKIMDHQETLYNNKDSSS